MPNKKDKKNLKDERRRGGEGGHGGGHSGGGHGGHGGGGGGGKTPPVTTPPVTTPPVKTPPVTTPPVTTPPVTTPPTGLTAVDPALFVHDENDAVIDKSNPLFFTLNDEYRSTYETAPFQTANKAQLNFTYNGQPSPLVLLSDGTWKSQVCIKVKAEDTCNVVYVCWQVAGNGGPNGLLVQLKSNPGDHTDAECPNGIGYSPMNPTSSATPPTITNGSTHSLNASVSGTTLTVSCDGKVCWVGEIPAAGMISAPMGIRSDNAVVYCQLLLGN
jgi:hypothetical protein